MSIEISAEHVVLAILGFAAGWLLTRHLAVALALILAGLIISSGALAQPASRPLTFTQDIRPIIEKRCLACHQEWNSPHMYSRIAWDWNQEHVKPENRVLFYKPPSGTHNVGRPWTSKYVAKFGRESLLYWKCVGERTDGRTDSQFPNDIDFGKPHKPGNVTREECITIARWIDEGVQR